MTAPPNATVGLDQPATLSFPAILRNPGLKNRYAHILGNGVNGADRTTYNKRSEAGGRSDREGKRRIRRRENAKFVSNPHIVLPTKRDYSVLSNQTKRTFPEPLPRSLKDSQTPAVSSPCLNDPNSTKAGQFTLPLRGVRKELRKCGPRAERLVRDVESELLTWLESGDVIVFAASGVVRDTKPSSASFSADGPIREIERSPVRLVWDIEEDGFARFVCHCVCRWHSVVSFSKADNKDNSPRLTYILRPNPSRLAALQASSSAPHHSLDTPPTTDFDSASSIGGVGAFSTQDSASDAETNHSYCFDSESEGTGDIDDDAAGSLSETSGMANSIPDLRDSITLPPITQHALRTRSSLVPTDELQALSLSHDDGEDAEDLGDRTLTQAEARQTPLAHKPRPRRLPRSGLRASRMGARSLSSSPSRSPSVHRRRREGRSDGIALPLMGIGKRARLSGVGMGGSNDGVKTLWSFVYE